MQQGEFVLSTNRKAEKASVREDAINTFLRVNPTQKQTRDGGGVGGGTKIEGDSNSKYNQIIF